MPPATICGTGTQCAGPSRSSVSPLLPSPATMNTARISSLPRLNMPSERSTSRGPIRLTSARTTITPDASTGCQAARLASGKKCWA